MPPLGYRSVSVRETLISQVRLRLWQERLPEVLKLLQGETTPEGQLRVSVAGYIARAIEEKLEREAKLEAETSQQVPTPGP